MLTTEATYHLAPNGVPARCAATDSCTVEERFASMDEAFGLTADSEFDFVF